MVKTSAEQHWLVRRMVAWLSEARIFLLAMAVAIFYLCGVALASAWFDSTTSPNAQLTELQEINSTVRKLRVCLVVCTRILYIHALTYAYIHSHTHTHTRTHTQTHT